MSFLNEVRTFVLRTDRQRQAAAEFILNLPEQPLMEVAVKQYEKIRTIPQNRRYFGSLTHYLKEIHQTIERMSAETGYTPLEIKRLIAKEMPAEYIAILFASRPETAHDVLKEICNVPTTTRLNTKQFTVHHEQMERVIAEISGEINAFSRRAA